MLAKEQESRAFNGIIKPYKLLEDFTIQQFLMKLRQNKEVIVKSVERSNGCGCGCCGAVHHDLTPLVEEGCSISGSYFIEAVYQEKEIQISFSGNGIITLFTTDQFLELTKLIR